MKRIRIHVQGVVQGVFFRASARALAEKLGLAGFARNEPDGSVTVEAEGEPAALEQITQWCRSGPPQAEIKSVTVTHIQPTGGVGFDRC
jgi:acylphosphatase